MGSVPSHLGRIGLIIAGMCFSAVWHAFADWPQFLGPQRDGIAHEAKKLKRSWADGGPKVLWQVKVGIGFAGPAVFGDSVLLLDREENARDVLRRLRLSDGQEIWRFSYDAPGKLDHDGSRTTPATDGKLIFTVGPFGHIHAVRFADGKPVWQKHMDEWGSRRPQWGFATSPLLLDDKVIIAPWGSAASVVALEKGTGKVIWAKTNPRNIPLDYSSPVPMVLDGKNMVVACGQKGFAIGLDADTGKGLWYYEGYYDSQARYWHIPSPTIVDGGRVFITGGYRRGAAMFKVVQTEKGYETEELWKNLNMGSKIAQALYYNGHIYGNSADTGGGLRCLTLDGQIVWDSAQQGARFEMGWLLIADGLIFILNGRGGRLTMVEATPERYKPLGQISVLSGEKVWAPIAYSDGKLIIRDLYNLVCLELPRQ